MAAGAHGHLQPAIAREPHTRDDVILAAGKQHRGRVAIGRSGVEHPAHPCLLVAGLTPPDHLAGEGHEINDWPPSMTMSTAFR